MIDTVSTKGGIAVFDVPGKPLRLFGPQRCAKTFLRLVETRDYTHRPPWSPSCHRSHRFGPFIILRRLMKQFRLMLRDFFIHLVQPASGTA